jgi:hypothetical protein
VQLLRCFLPCRRLDTNRGTYPGFEEDYEVAPTTADGALVTPGVFRSIVASIAEKLPQPLKGVVLGLNKVLPVDVKIAPTPWTPQVCRCVYFNVCAGFRGAEACAVG